MKEIENFLNSSIIDINFFNKTIDDDKFNWFTQKIDARNNPLINQLFWLSMTLYRISIVSYVNSIDSNNSILKRNNILIYFPFLTFSSEICRMVNEKYVYTSLLSTIARQMVEQICVVKEINYEKIPDNIIIKAMIESHNKHVSGKISNADGLNVNNDGILKVFKTNRKYSGLAKKYNYSFIYSFFSGDIHHISTIDKIIPQYLSLSSSYNEAYLKTLIGLVKESILFVNSFCKNLSKTDIELLSKYDFIDVMC